MEKEKICFIIGAGDITEKSGIIAKEEDLIICADGGYKYRNLLGRSCDLVIGDFDSLGKIPEEKNKVLLPREKDFTDMKEAVDAGLERGYRNFTLFGALGGSRFDHTLGNIQLLSYICSKGARCTIIDENTLIKAFSDGEITLDEKEEGYISVISLTDESKGVTIEGFKYTLNNATLRFDTPLGISNEFIGKKTHISVEKGQLMLVYQH